MLCVMVPIAGVSGLKLWTTYLVFQAAGYFSHLTPGMKILVWGFPMFVAIALVLAITGMARRALNPCYIDIDASGISLADCGKIDRYQWADLGQPKLSIYRSVGYGDSSTIQMDDLKNGGKVTITLIYYKQYLTMSDDIIAAYSGKPFGYIKQAMDKLPQQAIVAANRAKTRQQAIGVVAGLAIALLFAAGHLGHHT